MPTTAITSLARGQEHTRDIQKAMSHSARLRKVLSTEHTSIPKRLFHTLLAFTSVLPTSVQKTPKQGLITFRSSLVRFAVLQLRSSSWPIFRRGWGNRTAHDSAGIDGGEPDFVWTNGETGNVADAT